MGGEIEEELTHMKLARFGNYNPPDLAGADKLHRAIDTTGKRLWSKIWADMMITIRVRLFCQARVELGHELEMPAS